MSHFALSCFRSVVFHLTKDAILPGVMSHAYSFDGDLNPFFPESNCTVSVCSISGDMLLTDCPDNAKCLILWSLSNGRELTRTTRDSDVLTFAWSKDGRLAAVSLSNCSICLVDVVNNFQTVAEAVIPIMCGMIKFSPDHQFLYCWHCPLRFQVPHFLVISVNERNHENVSFDIISSNAFYEPWKFESPSESGFTFGDPIRCRRDVSFACLGSFVFVLNKQSVLRGNPRTDSVEILSLDNLTMTKGSGGTGIYPQSAAFSLNGDILYTKENGPDRCSATLVARAVSHGRIIGELSSGVRFFVPLDRGVLLSGYRDDVLKLWNFDLSKNTRFFPFNREIRQIVPIANERVGLVPDSNCLIIFDVARGCEVSVITVPGLLIACNSKCQLVIQPSNADSLPTLSIQLCDDRKVLWEKHWPPSAVFSFRGKFSPTDEFFVTSVIGQKHAVYVLDAYSGRTLQLWEVKAVECVFVSDKECVIQTESPGVTCLRLFNVTSGQQLSLLNVENQLTDLISSPRNSLIAFRKIHSGHFRVIRLRLPRDNKGTN